MGIHLSQPFAHIKPAVDVHPRRPVVAEAVVLEVLLHIQVAHIVQIHRFRHTHGIAFDGIAAVVHNIHCTDEAEVALACRHKGKLYATLAVNLHGVGDIVLVESGGKDRGEGADKAHRHQGYLV